MQESLEPIKIPITNVIDLHNFNPSEVAELLTEYFSECVSNGIFTLKIIHGKGTGILKKKVISFLDKSDIVESYKDDFGNWGAVIVKLKNCLPLLV